MASKSPTSEEYKPVPVWCARDISRNFDKGVVVIISIDEAHNLVHTTAYGQSAEQKLTADILGESLTTALGCDLAQKRPFEDFRDGFDAALYRESVELLSVILAQETMTPELLTRIEEFLATARSRGPQL